MEEFDDLFKPLSNSGYPERVYIVSDDWWSKWMWNVRYFEYDKLVNPVKQADDPLSNPFMNNW